MLSPEAITPKNGVHMVQYGVWPDCTNNCDFCLRLNRKPYPKEEKIKWLNLINENIKTIDWKNKFSYGISLLGGELYYIKDKDIQEAFLQVIDTIIEYVLKPGGPLCRYSTVTNGIYSPEFLYQVVDRIRDAVGMDHIDVNFSYDLKYRYKTEAARLKAFNNINAFHERYNYGVGIQMILTQHVINLWKKGEFEPNEFIEKNFPGCQLAFLYPHKVHTKKVLDDFYFSRKDLLRFVSYLKSNCYLTYVAFINSCKNSATFKYTGLNDRVNEYEDEDLKTMIPILADGKEEISECGHSILYRCYSDSDKCMLCDLMKLDPDL